MSLVALGVGAAVGSGPFAIAAGATVIGVGLAEIGMELYRGYN